MDIAMVCAARCVQPSKVAQLCLGAAVARKLHQRLKLKFWAN